jgi:hypothetical protein
MLEWISAEWHKVVIFLLMMDHLYDRLLPMFEKFHTAEQYLDRRFHERRHNMTPIATKVAEGFQILNIALSNAPKILADIATAEAAQKDPVAEMAALSQLLADLQPAVNSLIALVPPPPVTPAA